MGKKGAAKRKVRETRTRAYYPMPKSLFLLSNKVKTQLRYQEDGQLNPGLLGALAGQVYRANGLFDPDVAIGGHQPRGFDQMMAMYTTWTVISSKCTATFLEGSQQDVSFVVGISAQSQSSLLTTQDYQEDRYTVTRGLNHNGGQAVKLMLNWNASRFLNVKDPEDELSLQGTDVADPLVQSFFHIFAGPTYSTDPAPCDVNVLLDYEVIFSDPIAPSAS